MNVKAIDQLIARLNLKIVQEKPLLEGFAEQVRALQGHEREPLRWYTDARFLILQVDFDMMATIRAMLVDPSSRLTMEKYLALQVAESLAAVAPTVNGLIEAVREGSGSTAGRFDLEVLKAAKSRFDSAIAPYRGDTEFMKTLTSVRNTTAAHLWGKKGARLNGSAQWVLSRAERPITVEDVFHSKFVSVAIETLGALHELADDLGRGFETDSSLESAT